MSGRQRKDPGDAFKLMVSNDLIPLVEYPGALEPWLCRHIICGKEVTPRYASIQEGQTGCIYCSSNGHRSGLVDKSGHGGLPGGTAKDYMRLRGWEPKGPFPGSDVGWPSVHVECGREAAPSYNNLRRTTKTGCAWCSKKHLRISHEEASSTLLEHRLELLEQFPGAGKNALMRCVDCGTESRMRYSNVINHRVGCQHCKRACPKTCECRTTAQA